MKVRPLHPGAAWVLEYFGLTPALRPRVVPRSFDVQGLIG